eukprot:gene11573-biopygen13271
MRFLKQIPSSTEVPLPDRMGGVPGVLQQLREEHLAGRHPVWVGRLDDVGPDAGVARVPPAEHRAAGRAAQRLDIVVLKAHRLRR